MAGLDTQPSATTFELEDLVTEAWAGRIRVPHFQRDFRWKSTDVIRLFDSIMRDYPIGSLLLWVRHSAAGRVRLGAISVDAAETDNSLWVVDGQQRITSLANALHPQGNLTEPFNVYYDLSDKEFIPTPKQPEAHHIPLPVLFDLDQLISWFAETGKPASQYFPEARSIAKKLRQFKVPAYLVKQDDQEILTDIFDRMNNFGKRLKRAEIFSALYAGPEEGANERLSIGKIADRIADSTGFGTVDDDTVLHSILARRGPDTTREPRTEFDDSRRRMESDFPGEDQETAFSEGERALERAIRFLQDDAGVPHLTLLAYRAPLVILTRFFAHFPDPMERHRQLLRRLYWRVAVSGPEVFRGSFTSMARSLAAKITPGDESGSVRRLLDSLDGATAFVPDTKRFRTNHAGSKITLCSWWALDPRSPFTGERYDAKELSDVLVDQPTAAFAVQRLFPPHRLTHSHRLWAANHVLMPSPDDPVSEASEALRESPLDLDARDVVLTSHCIDPDAAHVLAEGDVETFLTLRQERIVRQLRDFLSRMAGWDHEDTPPLESLDFDNSDTW